MELFVFLELSNRFDVFVFTTLLFGSGIYIVGSEITVVRREQNRDGNYGEPDKFGIVSFVDCYEDYKADYIGNGMCKCKEQTSTFFKNSCIDNTQVEKLFLNKSDCPTKQPLHFKNQMKSRPMYPVFNLSRSSFDKVDSVIFKQAKAFHGQCRVNHVHYIEDWSGELQTADIFAGVFFIKTMSKPSAAVYLAWSQISQASTLNGRVIMLGTTNCTIEFWGQTPPVSNPCILFKAQGTLTSGSPTPSMSGSYSTKQTPQTSSKIPLPTSTLFSMVSTAFPGTLPVQPSSSPNPTNTITPKDTQQTQRASSQTGAIAGSVIAVLAALVIILVVAICRKRKHKSWRKVTVFQNSTNNPTYGRRNTTEALELDFPGNTANKEDEFEYDYAAMDGDPRSPGYRVSNQNKAKGMYQSLIPDSLQNSVYTRLNRENANISSDQPYGYNKIERPLFKKARPTDPLYNVLERPNGDDDYLEPGVQICEVEPTSKKDPRNNEPVYNVLEDPDDECHNPLVESDMGHPSSRDNAGYESPFEAKLDPVQDMQDEPKYSVLEDPDDDYDNPPIEADMGRPCSHDNFGYESPFEAKLDTRTKNGPVYEEPCGLSSDSTYQPLCQPLDRT